MIPGSSDGPNRHGHPPRRRDLRRPPPARYGRRGEETGHHGYPEPPTAFRRAPVRSAARPGAGPGSDQGPVGVRQGFGFFRPGRARGHPGRARSIRALSPSWARSLDGSARGRTTRTDRRSAVGSPPGTRLARCLNLSGRSGPTRDFAFVVSLLDGVATPHRWRRHDRRLPATWRVHRGSGP
jgi:hypothetical protein